MSWFGGGGNALEKHLFNLKLSAKQLQRMSVKCEKESKAEKGKIKKDIQKGNVEGARIHAENSIRQHTQSLNFLRMSSRIDAVSQRVETALRTQQVTKSMAGVVRAMDSAAAAMNLEQMTSVMDRFEKQFENLDVQTQYMDSSMSSTTTLTTPEGQVEDLMRQVAEEHGLELNMELDAKDLRPATGTSTSAQEQDDLTERLAKLRSTQS